MPLTRSRIGPWTLGLLLGLVGCGTPSAGPAPTGPGSTAGPPLPPPDSVILVRGDRQVAAFSNFDRIFPTRTIAAGDAPLVLPERPVDLAGLRFESGGETFDLDRFMEESRIAGLLVLREGAVVLERHGLGTDPSTRWVSFSVAKSVVSLLVGVALADGTLESLDVSVAQYLPELRGTAYEPVTFRHALQMASGVQWTDGYNAVDSDFNRSLTRPTQELLQDLGSRDRLAEPGTRFNYNSGETHLLGAALGAAIGTDLATYLSDRIWRPFGMEADAHWLLVEPEGAEHGGCCFSATLRDYGRLGLLALREGVLPDGTRLLPEGWMADATTPSPANPGYGALWWLREGGTFAALGIFGQVVWIDPEADLVVVALGAWPQPSAWYGRVYAFAEAVRDAL